MSVPELDALVARVGLEEARRLVRRWTGQRDAEAFLALPPAPYPNPLVRLQTEMLDALRTAETAPSQATLDSLQAAMSRVAALDGGGDNYRYCQERFQALRDQVL